MNHSPSFTLPVKDLGPIGGQKSKDYFYIQDIESQHNFVNRNGITFEDSIIAKHILFLGGIGTGKTNAINYLVKNIIAKMDKEDKIIFFDTKGDYLKFYNESNTNHFVISNKEDESEKIEKTLNYVKWNLFKEIACDKEEFQEETANEIARTLFDSTSKKTTNSFFPNSARQLTHAVLMAMLRGERNPTNKRLKEIFLPHEKLTVSKFIEDISSILENYPSMKWVTRNLDPNNSGQTLGILGEVAITIGDMFNGKYGDEGDFSIREFIRGTEKDEKSALFIEYDIGAGKTLTPIYRILIDLAIKETISRSRGKGKIYFVLDEFGRLPELNLIEAGINYGRELGARFVLGSQTVGQIINAYNKEIAYSILSGFGTVFAFNLFDMESRDFVSGRYGALRKFISYKVSHSEGTKNQSIEGKLIEDWHISKLQPGECLACLPNEHPRKVKFPIYSNTQ